MGSGGRPSGEGCGCPGWGVEHNEFASELLCVIPRVSVHPWCNAFTNRSALCGLFVRFTLEGTGIDPLTSFHFRFGFDFILF